MSAPAPVIDLVERFARNADAYKAGRYNETQLRREFIDPRHEDATLDPRKYSNRIGALL